MSVDDLLYWVSEREAIRKRKESGQFPPWTSDPILSTYRFCNIRRKDDRVSRWLRKYALTVDNLDASGLDSFIMFTALCRWINWPPTIEVIGRNMLWPDPDPDWQGIADC